MGRISLTSDLWSDSNMSSFMSVTLHWISRTQDARLELKTALGGFRWVKDKHSGENISARLIEVLDELGILNKIGGITMDNASNNNSAMEAFEQALKERGIEYNAQQQRLRCFAHILNLAVQDALASLSRPEAFDLRHLAGNIALKTEWRDGQMDTNYTKALQSDLVTRIQDLVRQLRSSGQRREALQQAIVEGNHKHIFPSQIKPLQLLRSVPTRWSSAYFMVERFDYLAPAIALLLGKQPNVTTLDLDSMLNVKETTVLTDIRELLSFFHSAQEVLAGEKTPTLPFVIPLYTELLKGLNEMFSVFPKLMHAVYASLKKLEKYREESRSSSLYMLATGMSSSSSW